MFCHLLCLKVILWLNSWLNFSITLLLAFSCILLNWPYINFHKYLEPLLLKCYTSCVIALKCVAMWQTLYNKMWVEVTCSLLSLWFDTCHCSDREIPSNCILEWGWCGSQLHQRRDGHVNTCFCCKPLIWRWSSNGSALFFCHFQSQLLFSR